MKEKGILKFKTDYSKGGMHYIAFEGNRVSVTLNSSRKVKFIKEQAYLNIAKNLLSRTFNKVDVTINDDKEYVKRVFEYMISRKHSHYKKWDDDFVVLEYNQ